MKGPKRKREGGAAASTNASGNGNKGAGSEGGKKKPFLSQGAGAGDAVEASVKKKKMETLTNGNGTDACSSGVAGFEETAREALDHHGNSKVAAEKLFAMLISPITVEEFYRDYFEKKPLLVKRKSPRFYDEFVTMKHVKMLVDNGLEWSYEVDATSYADFKRTTHNGEGQADPAQVWRRYEEGCSIRLLRPQRRLDHMCHLLSVLEEHWGSSAGANVYLTPRGTQGFAPHWDDIEAFILQTEGRKRWKVYALSNPKLNPKP